MKSGTIWLRFKKKKIIQCGGPGGSSVGGPRKTNQIWGKEGEGERTRAGLMNEGNSAEPPNPVLPPPT